MANISKQIWPRATWRTIHSFAAGADTYEKRIAFKQWILLTGKLIPCDECRQHFPLVLKRINIDDFMGSNIKLLQWTCLVHNDVNRRLGKEEIQFTDVYNFYLGQSSYCNGSCSVKHK